MRTVIISGFLLVSAAVSGQSNFGDIMGTLYNPKEKEPVAFAVVTTSYGEAVYKEMTDIDGRFRLSAIPSGKYKLMFIVEQDTMWAPEIVEVAPDGIGDAGTVNYLPKTTTDLGDYTLLYDKNQLHLKKGVAPEIKISGDDLRLSPLKFDPKGLISGMTSEVRKTDDGELVFRGERKGDMLCYVDGVKLRDVPSLPSASFSYMMVYTGAIPAKYGDTTGGVVVIETRSYLEIYRDWQSKMALAEEQTTVK